ncbi:SUMF1/EgtB/PvdO family nonheme iron enzyme [Nodosilinea sp. LEGE 07088]|nr:SUMF1/EgtB/PvdO family nonheme iron enzyme [Nodosilinea sp. LEGE 07088]
MLGVSCAAKLPASFLSPATAEARCRSQPGFIWVEAGAFQAGSDEQERHYGYQISAAVLGSTPTAVADAETQLRSRGWFDREAPSTTVTLPGFCMAQNLVTQADYQQFVAATGHRAPGISAADYQRQGFLVHPYTEVEPYLWVDNHPPVNRQDHPVVLVSYDDAIAYAQWQGQQDGVTYRLPTALEWEKAARGTDGDYFAWGSQWRDDATNWASSGLAGTSPVGDFPLSRSPYGIDDMAGNVFEFTSTPAAGESAAVMKGCSWDDLPGFCRAAYSHTRPRQSRHILFGFRLVLR